MPDQHVEPADRFLDAGAQRVVPLLKQGISLGDAVTSGLARTDRALDPAKRTFEPGSCRGESLFRHK